VDLRLVSKLLENNYQVLSELGRGGMGVVYLAQRRDSNRLVVLKMLQSGCFSDERERAQFRKEIEAATRLNHPGLVAVHEAGEVEGCPYYCMDYINGPSLVEQLRQGPVSNEDAAHLVRQIALAVHHAHEQGILHRDLKPSNILLDTQSNPHIIDFGLARHIGESTECDHGAIIGTPLYMAPEQAAGRAELLGPAADIYSLGAILYEMLTGRPPFGSSTLLATLRQVLETPPIPPRQINPAVHPDLEAICLRCLEKDPQKRYPSAQALADDLARFPRCQPVPASLEPPAPSRSRMGSQAVMLLALVLLLEHLALIWLALIQPGAMVWGALLLGGVLTATLLSAGWRPEPPSTPKQSIVSKESGAS